MTYYRKITGRLGEDIAARHLAGKGYRVLCRNYVCRLGEIDLVARDRDVLVFVEVRTRSCSLYGLPQESINGRKIKKLRQLAWHYLKSEEKAGCKCRFDVVAVLFGQDGRVDQLEHIENAF